MAETISVRVEDDLKYQLDYIQKKFGVDRSEIIRRLLITAIKEVKIEIALKMLREGEVSIGKAAEIAGITLYEMIERASEKDVHIGYSLEDLKEDMKRFGI